MKKRLLLLAHLLLVFSCAHVTPVVGGVVHCAEQATHEAALGLLDDVSSVLATGDWKAGLADMVKRFGEAAIDCAVGEIADSSNRKAQSTGDGLEQAKAERARAWIASRSVKLQ